VPEPGAAVVEAVAVEPFEPVAEQVAVVEEVESFSRNQ
jgi:hypothetical protein